MVQTSQNHVAGTASALQDKSIAYLEVGTPAVRFNGAKQCQFLPLQDAVLPALPESSRCLIVNASHAEAARAVLTQWRGHRHFGAYPAFTAVELDAAVGRLADGTISDLDDARSRSAPIQHHLAKLAPSTNLDGADRLLLSYLYARPELNLSPIRNAADLRLYHYPIADAMAPHTESAETWLRSLVNRGYLDQVTLADRVHRCGHCDSALLSFTDACVACRSVNIEAKRFMHCFTCGHVAPEDNFVRRQGLACPQCTKELRHIGTDYDRPLEDNICNDCGHHFAGGRAIARCLGCDQINDPEDLVATRFFNLGLSEKGALAARSGMLDQAQELVDVYRYATPGYLNQMLEWLLALCARHANEVFSVVSIHITNLDSHIDKVGQIAAWERVDTFGKRLTALTRDTDLLARMGRLETWVLLPKTDREGCAKFEAQIQSLTAGLQGDVHHQLEVDVRSVSVPEVVAADVSAETLLARLREAG